MHLPCSSTPVGLFSQTCFYKEECCPQYYNSEGSSINHLSRLNSTASALAVYASHYGHPACARLASVCWSDFDGWDSHPLGYKRNFKDHLTLFQSTGLSLAPCNRWFLFLPLNNLQIYVLIKEEPRCSDINHNIVVSK